ncbi:MAG: hypothetical protein DA330_04140, partial [Nitrososphaera sp.]|nr:hypothetical protein [Nitrososphaera sp.]
GLIDMEFALVNNGRIPAEEIYCEIRFPEGFEIFEKNCLPGSPQEPRKPIPMTLLQRIISSAQIPSMITEPIVPFANTPSQRPRMKIELNTIKINVPKIGHGFKYQPESFLVQIPSAENPKN